MYQMQIPQKQEEVDNSKIRALSDTQEIVYEGIYNLPQGRTLIGIIIALTWVINKPKLGVFE